MVKKISLFSLAALPLLLMAACDGSTQVDYDRTAKCSAIETYSWVGREHPEISD